MVLCESNTPALIQSLREQLAAAEAELGIWAREYNFICYELLTNEQRERLAAWQRTNQ